MIRLLRIRPLMIRPLMIKLLRIRPLMIRPLMIRLLRIRPFMILPLIIRILTISLYQAYAFNRRDNFCSSFVCFFCVFLFCIFLRAFLRVPFLHFSASFSVSYFFTFLRRKDFAAWRYSNDIYETRRGNAHSHDWKKGTATAPPRDFIPAVDSASALLVLLYL